MKEPREMTASEINRALDRLAKEDSRLTDAMIAAGRGHELPSETLKKTDPLALKIRKVFDQRYALKSEILSRTGSSYHRMPTRRRNPLTLSYTRGKRKENAPKTVDVFLPMPRASAVKWLKARRIPFTHMRDHFNGVAFRIRRGYLLDFQHEKDKAAPRYMNRTRVRRAITRRTVSRRTRRNPYRHTGKTYETTLNTVRVKFFQGYVEDVRYTRAEDGKPYSHVVETDAAELYLCEHATYGRCLLIVDPSGKTPLWG